MRLPPWILSAAFGALLLTVPPAWSQTAAPAYRTNSDRGPIPVGAAMELYLYGSYTGLIGDAAQATYRADGNVFDSKGRLIGRLIDSAGRDITSPAVNGDYRLRSPAGTEIGTTSAPSSTAGVRTLAIHPSGTGWPTAPVQNTASNGPVTTDQGGTTTGAAISSSIRAGVGGGLSETDQNTTTGTSSTPDTHTPTPSSAPVYSTGIVVAVPPGGAPVNPAPVAPRR